MSMGIGANAYLIDADDTSVLYAYSGYDDNRPERKKQVYDGRITINRKCFEEYSLGKIVPMISEGSIKVENCSNCWFTSNDELQIDIMALKVLFKLFREYQNDSEIPARVCFYC